MKNKKEVRKNQLPGIFQYVLVAPLEIDPYFSSWFNDFTSGTVAISELEGMRIRPKIESYGRNMRHLPPLCNKPPLRVLGLACMGCFPSNRVYWETGSGAFKGSAGGLGVGWGSRPVSLKSWALRQALQILTWGQAGLCFIISSPGPSVNPHRVI